MSTQDDWWLAKRALLVALGTHGEVCGAKAGECRAVTEITLGLDALRRLKLLDVVKQAQSQ